MARFVPPWATTSRVPLEDWMVSFYALTARSENCCLVSPPGGPWLISSWSRTQKNQAAVWPPCMYGLPTHQGPAHGTQHYIWSIHVDNGCDQQQSPLFVSFVEGLKTKLHHYCISQEPAQCQTLRSTQDRCRLTKILTYLYQGVGQIQSFKLQDSRKFWALEHGDGPPSLRSRDSFRVT